MDKAISNEMRDLMVKFLLEKLGGKVTFTYQDIKNVQGEIRSHICEDCGEMTMILKTEALN